MAFNSLQFVAFVTVVLVAYNAVSSRARPWLLLAASYWFYAASSAPHLGWLLLVTAATHAGAHAVARYPRKTTVAGVVAVVLLPLLLLKYAGFVAHLLNQLQSTYHVGIPALVLPVGISFYTFQAVSYVVDVYKQGLPPTSLWRVALYLAYFPQILAGPIERSAKLLPQLALMSQTIARHAYIGAKYMLWGFFCKLAVADNIASLVDRVLASPQEQSGASLWLAFSLYSFQIYFDFLGYTSIAIGAARCFNVRLSRNFNHPYAATSLQDFWRRWHITLSSWFRDYVYVPLGGHRTKGKARVAQVLAVFLLSGLWHGAALSFIAWGAFHGVAYLVEERVRRAHTRVPQPPFGVWQHSFRIVCTFTVVTIGWVFFRLTEFADIQVVLARMLFLDRDVLYGSLHPALMRLDAWVFLAVLLVALLLDGSRRRQVSLEWVPRSSRAIVLELALCNILIVPVMLLGDLGVRDFIYYRF